MRSRKLCLFMLAALMFGLLTGVAAAQQQPCGAVVFALTPDTTHPGGSVSASGSGAMMDDTFHLYLDSVGGQLLATGMTDGSGGFDETITIPADTSVGTHSVIWVGTDEMEASIECPQIITIVAAEEQAQEEPVQVDAYSATLPSTGYLAFMPVLGLAAAGAGVFLRGRRTARG